MPKKKKAKKKKVNRQPAWPGNLAHCVDVEGVPGDQMKGWFKEPDDWKAGKFASVFEDTFRSLIIPRSQWKDCISEHPINMRALRTHQWNQGREGSCTANAASAGFHFTWASQYGLKNVVHLSPMSLYKFCGRSPSSGSSVSCNVRRLRDVGGIPIANNHNKTILRKMGLDPAHTMNATGFYQRMPNGWKETAKHFRLEEYFDIRSVEGFISALLNGFTVHYGRSGHSIQACDAVIRNGKIYACYLNSWGNWGDDGFGYDSESYLRRTGAHRGAVAYRTIVATDAHAKLFDGLM